MFNGDINENTADINQSEKNVKNIEYEKDIENVEERLEKAFKAYKLSEVYLGNVNDDYGKLKIARLRLDFARHELLDIIKEANLKGIKLKDNEMIKKFLYDDI